jgi:hypothetical protein
LHLGTEESENKAMSISSESPEAAAKYRKIRIFVASPGDVQSERDQLAKVVEELNLTISAIAPEKNVILELVRWETHVHPGLGRDAQEVVNRQIGDYDIFIGILWKRMGTQTVVAQSGTAEEFGRAYEIWQKKKTFPVLFYFCQQPFPPPRTKEEVDQLGKVVEFRAELSNKGLVADYTGHDGFADIVRPHLLLVLGKMISPQESMTQAAERVAERTSPAESLAVRQQIVALAQEYEHVRASMDSGHPRTLKMEAVVSKMRTVALLGYPLLGELATSLSPGQRLMGVIILQSIPNPEYVPWLSERFQVETPFVGYHAALALLAAVRALHGTHAQLLGEAIAAGKKTLKEKVGSEAKDSDRYRVLDEAEQELKLRRAPKVSE